MNGPNFMLTGTISICAVLLLASVASAQVHPIVGKWQWTRDVNNCAEVYEYRVDGSLHVVSGCEVCDNLYEISANPDTNGCYELKGIMLKSNGGGDCSDSQSNTVGKPYAIYVIFHRTEPLHLACFHPSLSRCFGPLQTVH